MAAMIPNATLAKLFALAFTHVFPQCIVTMQVGDAWASTAATPTTVVRSIIRTSSDRDERLEEKIVSFRSRSHPGAQVISVTCAKAALLP